MIQGFHKLTAVDYHADPAPEPSLSSGIAKMIYEQCPAVAWYNHPRLNPEMRHRVASPEMDIGSAAHALLLEQDEDVIVLVDADDWRTKVARELRDYARDSGKIALLTKHHDRLMDMCRTAEEAIAQSEIAGILKDGEPEISALWEQAGCWNRARYDLLNRRMGICLDYKTTDGSADPASWIDRQIDRMGYDVQAAHYLDGVEAILGEQYKWLWLVQEQNPPFLCSLIGAGNATLALGHKKVDYARRTFAECLEKKVWPGYGNRIHWSEPQPWQLMAAEQREMMSGRGEE